VAQVSRLRPGVLQEGLGLIPAEDEQRMLTHSVAGSNKIGNWTIATVPFSPPSHEQYGTDDRTFFDRESYHHFKEHAG
jgi:hypothetical protein